MNLYSQHDNPESLHRHDDADKTVPELFMQKYRFKLAELEKREEAILKHPKAASHYACYILRHRWNKGEAIISTDARSSYLYAKDCIHGAFHEGEATIAKSAKWSYEYAYEVIQGAFKKGEAAIAKDAYYAVNYATLVIREPFPKGEKAIAKGNKNWRDIYLGRFPSREEAIEKLK